MFFLCGPLWFVCLGSVYYWFIRPLLLQPKAPRQFIYRCTRCRAAVIPFSGRYCPGCGFKITSFIKEEDS
jgi:DNA-directed RNA polymerase subunit RPC12/RpoP